MDTPSDAEFLADSLAPLCAPLHHAFEKAHEVAEGHFIQYDMIDQFHARELTDLTRAHARRELRTAQDAGTLGDWRLFTLKGGQTVLRCGLLRAKVLHVAPGKTVPHPGHNRARVSYYRNPPSSLFGVKDSRLLLLWSVDKQEGEVEFRVVRPLGAWKYGEVHLSDFDLMLPRESADLMTMEFTPDDSEIQLSFELGDEENYDDLADGW
ncbi:hypothetical protein QEZ54_25345 [Catellatospora sp. KI3]|uniref:hypothetical protein n=1 Tax=Catellatospora sp. KI3 TaxID=3041620 RepID=UPI002482D543|nr:hypothetical protein [Catellatospora sp. KI3]MDI1464301.1 hypothetical protein [Catellatospora sp. KI3]